MLITLFELRPKVVKDVIFFSNLSFSLLCFRQLLHGNTAHVGGKIQIQLLWREQSNSFNFLELHINFLLTKHSSLLQSILYHNRKIPWDKQSMGSLGRIFYSFSTISHCPCALSPGVEFNAYLFLLSRILKRMCLSCFPFKYLLRKQSRRPMIPLPSLTFFSLS